MNLTDVMTELERRGDESTRRTLMKHGAREPFFGVKVQDLKPLQKTLKKLESRHELALQLFATGNSDAMYLAGLIADESKMTREDLQRWVEEAYWYYLSEYAVPWVTAEGPFGFELGQRWIDASEERVASAGWATLGYLTAIKPDEELDLKAYEALLERAVNELSSAQNRVRYAMNGFIIAVGGNVGALTKSAVKAAKAVGAVQVDLGGTACKVPLATEYIQKIVDRGTVGKKRKSARL